ncbi:hypothetical protein Efla_006961 [Eimeria flavescens]
MAFPAVASVVKRGVAGAPLPHLCLSVLKRKASPSVPVDHFPSSFHLSFVSALPPAQRKAQWLAEPGALSRHLFDSLPRPGGAPVEAPVGVPVGAPPPSLLHKQLCAASVGAPSCLPLSMQYAETMLAAALGEPPLSHILGAPSSGCLGAAVRIEEAPEGAPHGGPLLFRWRPRKSYKQRTMGLASTKSRRRLKIREALPGRGPWTPPLPG